MKSRLEETDTPGARSARATLATVLETALRLLHPFTPFQTEVLWKALAEATGREPAQLVGGPWPEQPAEADDDAEEEMEVLQGAVRAVRSIRALTTLGDRNPLKAVVIAPAARVRDVLTDSAERVRALAALESLEVHESGERPPSSAVGVAPGMEVFVPLEASVDLGGLVETLDRRLGKLQKGQAALAGKLSNPGFLKGADPELVEAEKARQLELNRDIELLERNLSGLR